MADELYALPRAQFVATRTRREREARAAGDRTLAGEIHALGKPSAVAWLANRLVRAQPEEIAGFLDLGARLRQASATLAGDELRHLSRQEHQLVSALVQQARALAAEDGEPASEDSARALEETLRAALADPRAADALASGRLTEGLAHTGFPGTVPGADVAGSRPGRPVAPAGVASPRRPDDEDPQVRERRERRERAARAHEEAAQHAAVARRALESAQRATDQATAEAGRLADRVEQLRLQLEEAQRGAQEAARAAERAAADRDGAQEAVRAAESRLAETARALATADTFGSHT